MAGCAMTPSNEPSSYWAELKADYPGASFFLAEEYRGRTIACIENGRCMLFYEGETTPAKKMEVLDQAKQAGFTGFENGVLINFVRFNGVIDWEYAKRQDNIVPGFPLPSKVAYVVQNELAAMFAKGILTFSKNIEWKVFLNMSDARTWLGWT
jgi:hypothetical protein